jgi:hypothetical protein
MNDLRRGLAPYVRFEQISSILHFSPTNCSLSLEILGLNLVVSIRSISAANVQMMISHEIDTEHTHWEPVRV